MSLIQYCNNQVPLREVDELFSSFLSNSQWLAALDVSETKDTFAIKVDLPGVKKEDVSVAFDNGILTIQGERKSGMEEKDKNYHRLERAYGTFSRSLNLGADVNAEAIVASYKDGVLEIIVPKIEKAKPKAIDIQVA